MSAEITIVDVGPRDGLQNLPAFIPTETKKGLIDLLADAGIRKIEAASFVSPKAIPQMTDAQEVVRHALANPKLRVTALVPNMTGAIKAVECGLTEINFVISVSEAHNIANINKTPQDSLAGLQEIKNEFPELDIHLSFATAFGCPFTGCVPPAKVKELWLRAEQIGIRQFILADTIGVATPRQTTELLEYLCREIPTTPANLALHMHNTHGLALANYYAAWRSGVRTFEGAVGGLGGCPFAPGAAGNAATEDILNLFDRIGVNTGVAFDKYMQAVAFVKKNISANLSSRLSSAKSYREFIF